MLVTEPPPAYDGPVVGRKAAQDLSTFNPPFTRVNALPELAGSSDAHLTVHKLSPYGNRKGSSA